MQPVNMPSPPDSSNPVSNLVHNIFSYDDDDDTAMLVAILSLLLVILFVLLLHFYAKWFLAHARGRSSSTRRSVSVSHVLGPARFHHFNALTFDTSLMNSSPAKGLEARAIALIPLFVYKSEEHQKHGVEMECVVCLSVLEEGEVGRKLPVCGHGFHVECVDMWLHSHSTCPICRAPVVVMGSENVVGESDSDSISNSVILEDTGLEIVIEVPNFGENYLNEQVLVVSDTLSVCSSSSSSVSVGGSVKRIPSRSRCECKVHPSSNVNESED